MNRDDMVQRIEAQHRAWDILIIGGGATGLGCAVDAASRGYDVLLLEQHDFAKGTSSRSTKLVHGGVRYLQQGNVKLVLEALKERGILRQNAPHLVHDLPFVVPNYAWWESPFYGIGLRVYDMLAGKLGFGPSRNLSVEETIARIPTIETEGLQGGVIYHDGQFDDARLAINLARTAVRAGAIAINYFPVTGLIVENDLIQGVRARDAETDDEYALRAKIVINATGVFADSIRAMQGDGATPMIKPSQGVHIVLDREFLPGDSAIMVPHTDDGRVLFAVPWHDKVVVGTTDTPVESAELEPRPKPEELAFLLEHAARYLTKDPGAEDVRSTFAGLRPLVGRAGEGNTSSISRDHTINVSPKGLLTIAGGKWTTYRKMAEDTIDQAAVLAGLDPAECVTKTLRIHGHGETALAGTELSHYGTDAEVIQVLAEHDPRLAKKLHARLPYTRAEVVHAVRHEMARTPEDVLSRRTRALLLDAAASIETALEVTALMAEELGHDAEWKQSQASAYEKLAAGYLIAT